MALTCLEAQGFRNLVFAAPFEPAPRLNLFVGANGTGKTSLLEAIGVLGTGRSFRTTNLDEAIAFGEGALLVRGEVRYDAPRRRVAVVRTRRGLTRFRLDGDRVRASSSVARLLPLLLLGPDSVALVAGEREHRRRFLDWGVFHVEHSYASVAAAFARCLRQRNSVLREHGAAALTAAWNEQFCLLGERVHRLRAQYLAALNPVFAEVAQDLLGLALVLAYRPGWDPEVGLAATLREHGARERELGYSLAGPQRADLRVTWDGRRAAAVLSRGQQKTAAYAMLLAQGVHLRSATAKVPIYLVDDLQSELDATRREAVWQVLTSLDSQVFVTATDPSVAMGPAVMFHVKQGEIRPHN